MNSEKIKNYYRLAKPGIIYGNALTAAAGFILASKYPVNPKLFLLTLIGISFVIGGGCVFNNYLDRSIDSKMERTKRRVLVSGVISGRSSLIYGTILELIGMLILALHTNLLTFGLAIVGFIFYVFIYTFAKRYTVYSTIIGSVSGSIPPLVGYCAVSNRIDLGAVILFLTICFWQMPHFYAISIYRVEDYRSAGLPVLSVQKGTNTAKKHIPFYILAYLVSASLLVFYHYTGLVYLVLVMISGLVWLAYSLKGFRSGVSEESWAKKVFGLSLVVIMLFCLAIPIDKFFR
ncbi:MAG: Protoheme farnesyltransferase [Candidatus Doudnabacteria bacterium]|nr:Protoheme farnesyltransferase [Candidatus Doudnabacteria bacterium]